MCLIHLVFCCFELALFSIVRLISKERMDGWKLEWILTVSISRIQYTDFHICLLICYIVDAIWLCSLAILSLI